MNASLPTPAPTLPESRAQQIIEAATSVLARQGYAATSMKDIAREAGIAQGLIHYYFGSKDDLVTAVLRQHCGEMMASTRDAFERSQGSPLARAWATLEATRERTMQRPELFRLFFELLPLSFTNETIAAQLRATYTEMTEVTLQMVEELSRELPCPVPVPMEDFARVIVASIDGLALRSLVEPEVDIEALFRALSFVLMCTMIAAYASAGQAIPPDAMLQQLLDEAPESPIGARG